MDKEIDAVVISTPDHMHGTAAKLAMEMGKHVYCQKPLTQTVYEARELVKLAKDKKLSTQMGNQGSAGKGLHRAVEVIQSGVIGNPVGIGCCRPGTGTNHFFQLRMYSFCSPVCGDSGWMRALGMWVEYNFCTRSSASSGPRPHSRNQHPATVPVRPMPPQQCR